VKFPGHNTRWLPVAVVASAMLLALLGADKAAAAAILRVPQDFPTIQAAINAAAVGDTVLVSPGTYVERIDFQSKEITVESAAGPADTIIDGNQAGAVVTIRSSAGQTPVLRGFTIRNGNDTSLTSGGGVGVFNGPALIEGNWLMGNASCEGGGITARFSAATIRGNVISGNRPNCSGGTGGGGIFIGGAGTVQVLDNVITGNISSSDGGGIGLFAAGTPTISGNVISDNQTSLVGSGGGISMVNHSDALITNNVITGNRGRQGGGIYWLVPLGPPGPTIVNNTIVNNGPIADNTAQAGSAVFADGFDAATRLINNILSGSTSQAVLDCGTLNDSNPPIISHNDVFNAGTGPDYGGGICPDQTDVNGNISADPLLIDPAAGNFHLRGDSPAIDAGLNADAPATDIDGDARPLDGNGDGVPVVDIGADELSGGDTTPPTITCTATPATLSPANHRLRSVSVDISASDDSGAVNVTLVSVTNSQADSGLGHGDMPNDIQGWTTGTDDRSGLLRAERFGATRVYTLTYQARDPAGNTATCQTTVTVPSRA
jgi:parallel beta-helix repeat protein